ncbi:hypothetical protein [Niabella soli]|uniref:Uncharacterized protein n=1 Tax=Niabella soli DSM 19437 TaxID=929713 RepID=W0F820_9BACT|nr:hypothetical protein [Niabella soli]AHF17963.1 hypothetical protein NIASO_17715 [Niabella soli DSM 19437]
MLPQLLPVDAEIPALNPRNTVHFTGIFSGEAYSLVTTNPSLKIGMGTAAAMP